MTKTLLTLSLLIALASYGQDTATIKPSPALDSPVAEEPMPDKQPTNAPVKPPAPPIAELIKKPGLRPPSGSNDPIKLQSAHVQPQPIQPTFGDGVRLGFAIARRNQDLNDLNAVFQYAAAFWNQEQQQRQAAANQVPK